MSDDLELTVKQHTKDIGELRDGFDRHNAFLFGVYDEDTNTWSDGFAHKLTGAMDDIQDIRKSISDFTGWIKTGASTVGKWAIGLIGSGALAAGGFVVTHWDKIVAVLR